MTYGELVTARPQFTDQVYQSIISLENDRNFQVFVEFLTKRATDVALLSIDRQGVEGEWLRGRAQELRDLKNCIKNARKDFDLIKGRGGK